MARCKSRGAAITWVKTTHGKSMPLDLKPAPTGNVWLDIMGLANVLAPGEDPPPGTGMRYMPHWATCPNASQHRKAREP